MRDFFKEIAVFLGVCLLVLVLNQAVLSNLKSRWTEYLTSEMRKERLWDGPRQFRSRSVIRTSLLTLCP